MLVVQDSYSRSRQDYVGMEYSPKMGHYDPGASVSRSQYARLDDGDLNVTNSSQPSLTYSVSTHADSVPSSISRRDFNNHYAASDYASEAGQQTSFEDDSDIDSLQNSMAARRAKVKFMTLQAVTRETATNIRPLGTKRHQQKGDRPVTSALIEQQVYRGPAAPALASLSVDEEHFAGARRRASSNADASAAVAARRLQNMTLAVDSFPPPPVRPPTTSGVVAAQRAPLSVLDEFEWHGATEPSRQQQVLPSPPPHTPSASPYMDPQSPQATQFVLQQQPSGVPGIVRSKGSMATLMPRRAEAESGSDHDHPFAFSPPSVSHDGLDDQRSLPGSARHSFSQGHGSGGGGTPSVLELSSTSASMHSNDIEPRELLQRAKTSNFTCGLDEELTQSRRSSEDQDETAEVIDDLPPLLSTYYLAEQGLSREQFDRLARNPERMRAAHQAALRAEKERKTQHDCHTLKSRSGRDSRDDEEPISILKAEAKFLSEDPNKFSSSSSGGGKFSALLKKKASSSNGNTVRGGRSDRVQGIASRSDSAVGHQHHYRDGNGGIYSSPYLSNRSGSASVASSSSRDLRIGAGNGLPSSEVFLNSYAAPLSTTSSSAKGLAKLFGRKK